MELRACLPYLTGRSGAVSPPSDQLSRSRLPHQTERCPEGGAVSAPIARPCPPAWRAAGRRTGAPDPSIGWQGSRQLMSEDLSEQMSNPHS